MKASTVFVEVDLRVWSIHADKKQNFQRGLLMVGLRVLSSVAIGLAATTFSALGLSQQAVASCVAQGLNPCSGGGYTASTTNYTFNNISTSLTATRILANANTGAESVNVGFNFNFFGSNYSSLFASTNGTLAFGTANVDNINRDLETDPITRYNAPTIAVLWDAWTFKPKPGAVTDALYYQTSGAVGSRQFTVQWNQAASKFADAPTGTVTFQAVLFENSNNIVFSYLDTFLATGTPENFGAGSTVGIRNTNGNVNGQRLEWSYNTPFSSYELLPSQSILFSKTP